MLPGKQDDFKDVGTTPP